MTTRRIGEAKPARIEAMPKPGRDPEILRQHSQPNACQCATDRLTCSMHSRLSRTIPAEAGCRRFAGHLGARHTGWLRQGSGHRFAFDHGDPG